MALTANLEISRYVDQELRSYKVLGSAHIFKGALVGLQRSSGYVRPLQLGDAFAGIAYEEVDNTTAANGDRSIRLFTQGDFLLTVGGVTLLSIGRPIFASADDLPVLVISNGATYIGQCIDVPAPNTAIVRITTFEDSQTVRAEYVSLQSLTTGPTTNPVMITHKPILIYAAQVLFNTRPDQGILDVGTDNTDPDEIVDAFNLATLTNNTVTSLPLVGSSVARDQRIWAKVSQANTTPGVGGLLVLRYIELP